MKNSNRKNSRLPTREEFDEATKDFSPELREQVWGWLSEPTGTSLDIVDCSFECSMCGKPMTYRFCGMCTHCEMVWNS